MNRTEVVHLNEKFKVAQVGNDMVWVSLYAGQLAEDGLLDTGEWLIEEGEGFVVEVYDRAELAVTFAATAVDLRSIAAVLNVP